jgi:hypothetical protein
MTKYLSGLILSFCLCANAGTNGLNADAKVWTNQIYLAILGDSIVAGGGSVSTGTSALPQAITKTLAILISLLRLGARAATWYVQKL